MEISNLTAFHIQGHEDIPVWSENLSPEEFQIKLKSAISMLQYVALELSTLTASIEIIPHGANNIEKCFLFLCRNDLVECLSVYYDLSTSLHDCNNVTVQLKFVLTTIKISVTNITTFKAFITIAMARLIPQLRSDIHYALLPDLCTHLLSLCTNKSDTAPFHLEALFKLFHYFKIDTDNIDNLILDTMVEYALNSTYIKAINFASGILSDVMANWHYTKLNTLLDVFKNLSRWEISHLYIAKHLISSWPNASRIYTSSVIFPKFIGSLLQPNLKHHTMQLYTTVIHIIDFNTWSEFIAPALLSVIPEDSTQDTFIKLSLFECIDIAVQKFRFMVYTDALTKHHRYEFCAIAILHCVRHGFVTVESVATEIKCFLNSSIRIVQYYAMSMLCCFKNKQTDISEWRFTCVLYYLITGDDKLVLTSIRDLKLFLSHMCVVGNKLVCKKAHETLLDYASFIIELYNLTISLLKSKSHIKVELGYALYHVTTFLMDGTSTDLVVTYNLNAEDLFQEKKCSLLQFFKDYDYWCFDNLIMVSTVFKEFLFSEESCIPLFKLMFSWIGFNTTGKPAPLNFILNAAKLMINRKMDYHSAERATLLVDLAIRYKKAIHDSYQGYIKEVKDELIRSVGLIKRTKYLTHKLIEIAYLYTYMATYLTTENFFSAADCDLMFDIAITLIKRVLNLLNLKYEYSNSNQHQMLIVQKNGEQLLIVSVDLIYAILQRYGTPRKLQLALETAKTIISMANRKSPISHTHSCLLNICRWKINIQENNIQRFLNRAMEFLLGILSDPSSSNSSTAAVLHTLEILVSDNSIRNATVPYLHLITVYAINEFSNSNWKIKNATIQILQSIVSRLLGQYNHKRNRRFNSMEGIFTLYPEIAKYFYLTLSEFYNVQITDSNIAILAFISESYSTLDLFSNNSIRFITNSFLSLCRNIICEDPSTKGVFAAKAYASLYPENFIPYIICDTVFWLQSSFSKLSRNVFYSTICLLKSLFVKFNMFTNSLHYKIDLRIIELAFQCLLLFFNQFNNQFEFSLFSLLNVRTNPLNVLENTIFSHFQIDLFYNRIWLHNNLPYVLNYISIDKYPNFLKMCLNQVSSLSFEIYYLDSILNRKKELLDSSLLHSVLLIILEKILLLCNACSFLIVSYSHTISLLLLEMDNFKCPNDLLIKFRDAYWKCDKTNIYIASVYAMIFSYSENYTVLDKEIIKGIVKVYNNTSLIHDIEIQFYTASTLLYIYKCVEKPDRKIILKVAFILLLHEETAFEICKFISIIFDKKLFPVYQTLNILLDYENLVRCFESKTIAAEYILELAIFTTSLSDYFEDCGEFYLKRNSDICKHKYTIKQMLFQKLKWIFSKFSRTDCIKLLHSQKYLLSIIK